jgi:Uma2 family endonuclease
MGMPATSQHYWTPADLRALPDDGLRHECIDGEHIVTPAPRAPHQRAAGTLFRALGDYLDDQPVGEGLFSPADLELIDGNLVQPDVFVTRRDAGGGTPREWPDMRALHVAIEVLSPTTARYDRGLKRRFFQRADVGEYWIVDLDARLVERWRHGTDRPEIASDILEWQPEGAERAFVLELPVFFAAVLGD